MKKLVAVLLSAVLSVGLLSACGGTGGQASSAVGSTGTPVSGQLNLYTWEGMFPQEILDGFESTTGIKINYVNFDYDETMLAKLEAANGGDYDLVIADDYIIEAVIAEGLAQKLDTTKLANYDNINPIYQGQFFDPSNEYTVPYGAGVQTIVYNPNDVDFEITGYEDLWNEGLADSVGVIANYRVINGMALKVLGDSYNTEDLDEIQKAGDLLQSLAPNIRVIKDDNIQDDLISGEISAGVMYTSQVTTALLSNPDLKVVFPSEGIGFGIMAGFIPSQAPNAEAAYKFLDYILEPENAASCFEFLGYYSTNAAADAFINEDYKSFLTLPDGFDTNMEMIQNISTEAEALHSKIWDEFKAASGQ